MQLHVGTATLRGNVRAYAQRFDLLELRADRAKLPRTARLKTLVSEAPKGFVFSLLLPKIVCALGSGPEVEQELAHALAAADVLDARFLVVQTEPSVMPSARNTRLLAELVGKLPRERRIAWEPRGLWEDERAEAVARELGLVLVRDVSRELPPPGEVLFTRLRALGRHTISLAALERAAEAAVEYEEACVLLEGDGAVRAAKSLRELYSELAEQPSGRGETALEELGEDEDELDDEHSEDEDGPDDEYSEDDAELGDEYDDEQDEEQ